MGFWNKPRRFPHWATCDGTPKFVSREGADHHGKDFYRRCAECGLRTERHVEGLGITDEIRRILLAEWGAGRTTEEPIL